MNLASETKFIRAKWLFKQVSKKGFTDKQVLTVSDIQGIIPRSESNHKVRSEGDDISGFKLVQPNDFVIGLSSFEKGILMSEITGLVSPAYVTISPTNYLNNNHFEFFKWQFIESQMISKLGTLARGIRQGKNIAYEDFGQLLLPVPNEIDSVNISTFLNKHIAKVDEIILKFNDISKSLEEKGSALITQVITKGLNPNVPMMDSGIDWIGEIPSHWRISKAKRHSEIFVPERNKPKQNSNKIGIPWITTSDIGAEYVSEVDTELWVSEIEIDTNGSRILPQNSVIATCVGEFGLSSINTVDCIINQQLQAYITNSIHPEFLRYVLIAGKQYFESVCNVTTLSYVNKEKFGEIPIPHPSISEQKEIATWLSHRLAKISEITAEISNSIVKFSEYRTALISAAVTGKIDVRGL